LLLQVSSDLPCYLLGHGMGALVINSFLGRNTHIAEKIAGVVYSAPLFGTK
jgi:alpha-beta hydrolase superfamily lysophospholipase